MKPRDGGGEALERPTAAPAARSAGAPDPVEAEPEDELIMHLERDQFVAETSRPVDRATLGRHSITALWALRVFAIAVSVMVVYTFVSQLS
jgi:hypothetical protein